MPALHALVYVSTADHPLSAPEIDHLLERARARNEVEGVTGVLLYSRGNFMQFIEGSAAGMATVYAAITADPLHHGIIELLNEPRASREFSDWAMAFRSVDALGVEYTNVNEASLSDKLEQPATAFSPARVLLSGFWHRAQGL